MNQYPPLPGFPVKGRVKHQTPMNTLILKNFNPSNHRILACPNGERLFTADNLRSAMKALNFDSEQIQNVIKKLNE